ncbi:alpha/beta hydrolase family protein [Leptospira ryugenii]|uniref:Alpha/beta hydrolase family protein n=1 Tax=Leptospira ryugenii TaxID=1917863 RepID=A0A2P2DYZ6_9LEPT|nr:alpha/beta hydrolase [Leptospira ryugenii]GBF49852.1 alpha/beta hydrolase family protein [Leptospira ryugenii]
MNRFLFSISFFALVFLAKNPVFGETVLGLGYKKIGVGTRNIVMLPGIGDLKENYLDLATELSQEAQIHLLDLRGTGESRTDFASYGADETANDLEAFIVQNDLRNVIIVGNSMTCASAILVATRIPERIQHIFLTGPFVEDKELSWGLKWGIKAMFNGPWGAWMFQNYYMSLYPVTKPKDLETHASRIYENLKEKDRLTAVRSMFLASKPKSAEALFKLKVPHTFVMGDKDPDFDDPVSEAKRLQKITNGDLEIFEGSGHYPYKDNFKRLAQVIRRQWEKN